MDTVSASKDAQQKRPGNLTIFFVGIFQGAEKDTQCYAQRKRAALGERRGHWFPFK